MVSHLPLKAVIFDCDGVLVDTEPVHYQAFQEILGPLGMGHDYDHYLKYYIGFDDRDAFKEAFREGNRPLDSDTLASLIKAKDQVVRKIIAKGVTSFPGVVELVRELAAQKVPLAVASGALRHEVVAFIDALGLKDVFPIIVAADDVSHSKPDPETYLTALARVGASAGVGELDPVFCIAIEDTPTGIESAKAAGLYVIGVTNSFSGDLLGQADHVLGSLAEIDLARLVRLIER